MAEKPIPPHMKTLAERVHILRRRLRFSQAELAKQAGMSPTTMSNIEQAKAPTITVEHLVALARALQTTTDFLLGIRQGRKRQEEVADPELFTGGLALVPAVAQATRSLMPA